MNTTTKKRPAASKKPARSTSRSRGKDYLAEFDAAASGEKYPLIQRWIKEDPLPFFKQLREERPVLETPECTLIANFTDVRDMLQMPKIFTVDLYKPKMGVTSPNDGYLMAHDDDALHYREKSLMQGLLNRDDLPRIRKLIAETGQEILDEAEGSIELVNNYCRMVPVTLVQDYFGLDGIGKEDLIRWSYWNQYDAFNNQPFDLVPDSEYEKIVAEHDRASEELVTYIATLMGRKWLREKFMRVIWFFWNPLQKLLYRVFGKIRGPRKDTIVMRLLRSRTAPEADFPLTRVGVNVGGLLIGAIETTSQAVAQVVDYFIRNPELLEDAKNKARESTTTNFDAMVWEALRFVPIRPDIFRKTVGDYTIAKGTPHETEIKDGTIVRMLIHSAMHDDYAYSEPEKFQPGRNVYHNFVFGFGPHECMGKYVGIEMVPEMVRQVVLRANLKSDGEIDFINPIFPERQGPFPEKYEVSWTVKSAQ